MLYSDWLRNVPYLDLDLTVLLGASGDKVSPPLSVLDKLFSFIPGYADKLEIVDEGPYFAPRGHQCIATRGMWGRCIRRIWPASLSRLCVIVAWRLLEFPHHMTSSLVMRSMYWILRIRRYSHNLILREIQADFQISWRWRNIAEAFPIQHRTSVSASPLWQTMLPK